MPSLPALPIDPLLGDILRTLTQTPVLVLEAPPGAGKTTRVPWAALEAVGSSEVVVSEPRRVAARLAAERVARERAEDLGGLVGYSVRFEHVGSPKTRLRYVTDGVLARRLVDDPELRGIGLVVLDEFHERRLPSDLVLALVRRLQTGARPDLRLLVMSATLDGERLARALGDCPRITSQGRRFPVALEHAPKLDQRPLDKQVASAVRGLLAAGTPGDVLVFLPGAAEIRRALATLEPLAQEANALLMPLHGDLPLAEQRRAVEPATERKIVLSTNVAESSITLEGVTAVVDSGLERRASHSPWSGLSRLSLGKISRASAAQRAGRAGRTGPGQVVRLYTQADHDARPEHEVPEILRADLTETVLLLAGAGVTDAASLPWLDPPARAQLVHAEELLTRLGAIEQRVLTPMGRRMLDFRVAPRLGRVLVEAERRGVAEEACALVGLLGERDPRLSARSRLGPDRGRYVADGSTDSDLLELLELFEQAASARFDRGRLGAMEVDPWTLRNAERTRAELARLVRRGTATPNDREEALGLSILAGFADRVARRRWPGRPELILMSGEVARLAPESVVEKASFMVAVEADESRGHSGGVVVRQASAIQPEWLLEVAPESLVERRELLWNSDSERVEEVRSLAYGAVVLEESRRRAPPSAEASEKLWHAARALPNLFDQEKLERLRARLELLVRYEPELVRAELAQADLSALMRAACQGRTSLAELRSLDLTEALLARLEGQQRRRLEEYLPERFTLPSGRRLTVHYERDRPPFIASRLQDFFGMTESPRLCRGKVVLTVHLLAPSQRAVQVTSDLSGFWQRHYPTLRRELLRKYPKHSWPEDGARAAPPKPPDPRARRS
jgi:ATP-dependent helicase HrpB